MGVREVGAPRRAVFLDRDGVLNEPCVRDGRPYPPLSVEELIISEGATEALHDLKKLGFVLIVVSNQPDVARGTLPESRVRDFNAALRRRLPALDAVYVCIHDDKDACRCRKPLPGLLEQASKDHAIALEESYMVGDRWRDVDAGAAAGCRTILISRDYNERPPAHTPTRVVRSIREAAQAIVRFEQNGAAEVRA